MRVKLKADYSLEFIDGTWNINENDDLVHGVEVELDVPTTSKERLQIAFQRGVVEDNLNDYTYKLAMYKQPDRTWQELIPSGLLKIGGTWSFQIFRERLGSNNIVMDEKASSVGVFTIGEGVKTGEGGKVTAAMLQTVWENAEQAEAQAIHYANQSAAESKKALDEADRASNAATAAVNNAAIAERKAVEAETSAKQAEDAKDVAVSAKENCEGIQANVTQEITVIAGYKDAAEIAAAMAEEAQVEAETASSTAKSDAVAATNAAAMAGAEKSAAETAKTGAESARDATSATAAKVKEQYDKVMQVVGSIDKALTFSTYQKAIEHFNVTDEEYAIGQSIYIATTGVPDLWIADISPEASKYNFISDSQLLSDIRSSSDGMIKVGKYYLSEVEAALDNYVKKTDYATENKAGVVTANPYHGLKANGETGALSIVRAEPSVMLAKSNGYQPLTPKYLDYAVKVGMTTNTETLTDEEKASACEWLGAAPKISNRQGRLRVWVSNSVAGYWTDVQSTNATALEGFIPIYVKETDGTAEYNGWLLCHTPNNPYQTANKNYVDNLPDYLTLTDAEKAKWREMVGAGTSSSNGVSQEYVDGAVQGIEEAITAVMNNAEEWTFTFEDGTTVTKEILVK